MATAGKYAAATWSNATAATTPGFDTPAEHPAAYAMDDR